MKFIISFILSVLFINIASCSIIHLNGEEEFEEKTSNGIWFIKFYAPWCGHCKILAPVWEELSERSINHWNVAKVDCTDENNKGICDRYSVRGYPTLKLFINGEHEDDYRGNREIGNFVRWVEKLAEIEGDSVISLNENEEPKPVEIKRDTTPSTRIDDNDGLYVLTSDNLANSIKEIGVYQVLYYVPWNKVNNENILSSTSIDNTLNEHISHKCSSPDSGILDTICSDNMKGELEKYSKRNGKIDISLHKDALEAFKENVYNIPMIVTYIDHGKEMILEI